MSDAPLKESVNRGETQLGVGAFHGGGSGALRDGDGYLNSPDGIWSCWNQDLVPLLYRYGRHLGLDRHTAEDIVQEVAREVHEKPCSGISTKPDKERRAIAITIYRRRYVDWCRRRGDTPLQLPDFEPDCGGPAPDTDAMRREEAEKIRKAIDQLPDGFREVVILSYLEELTYEEIAATLEISIGTVKSRLFRARARLQQMLVE